jgi:transcriptional regulator with XRE-family HTH domain
VTETSPDHASTHEGGLGALLRRARAARNLTLEAAARALAVPVPVLAALEEERLEIFEALVYLKGHAARYGTFLGCAADELEAAVAEAARRYLLSRPSTPRPTPTPPSRRSNLWITVVSAAILLVLVGGYFLTLGRRLLRRPPAAVASRPSGVARAVAPPPLVAHLPKPKALLPPPRPLLVLVVRGTSWISVRDLATGTSLFRGLAPPPHHLRFFRPGRYRIVLGRARNVSVFRDGRPWTPPSPPPGSASERFIVNVAALPASRPHPGPR